VRAPPHELLEVLLADHETVRDGHASTQRRWLAVVGT
jgi:hypothetical protein